MLSIVILALILYRNRVATVLINVTPNAQFIPNESLFQVDNISMVFNLIDCTCQCWTTSLCVTATYRQTTEICTLFSAQLSQGHLEVVPREAYTTTITFLNRTVAVYGVNLLINGDAETGPCATDNTIVSPTDWSYYGSITQMSYNSIGIVAQSYQTPGPGDRGRCYFVGNTLQTTSMFQKVDLSAYAADIDREYVAFNLSAWLGGSEVTETAVTVSIAFQNSASQTQGDYIITDPVSSGASYITAETVFYQAYTVVPAGTRSALVSVNMTAYLKNWNAASVDNIRLEFLRSYQ